ncbi:MAG: riboflavin kinase [Spirochaetales bacterium]
MTDKFTCVSFGYFDGMHLGHGAIVDEVLRVAGEKQYASVIVTLYDDIKSVHTTEREKEYYLAKKNIDFIVSKKCTADFDVKELLQSLNAKAVVVGENFLYRGIDVHALTDIAKNIGVETLVCPTVAYQNIPISGLMLDEALSAGDYERYDAVCGHPYTFVGIIKRGKGLGRTVGMPTANLDFLPCKKIPADGVYATISRFGNDRFMGLTNVGKRPSVDDEDTVTVETHILDFSKDVYGEESVVEVRFFIRDVVKFNNLQEVQKQVQKDIEKSKEKLHALFM